MANSHKGDTQGQVRTMRGLTEGHFKEQDDHVVKLFFLVSISRYVLSTSPKTGTKGAFAFITKMSRSDDLNTQKNTTQ